MYRMYGLKIAPAFSALPPSMAVVCRGRMAEIAPAIFLHFRRPWMGKCREGMDALERPTSAVQGCAGAANAQNIFYRLME